MLPSAFPDVNNVGVPRATPVTAARFRKSRLVTFFCSLILSLSLFEFGLQMTATKPTCLQLINCPGPAELVLTFDGDSVDLPRYGGGDEAEADVAQHKLRVPFGRISVSAST